MIWWWKGYLFNRLPAHMWCACVCICAISQIPTETPPTGLNWIIIWYFTNSKTISGLIILQCLHKMFAKIAEHHIFFFLHLQQMFHVSDCLFACFYFFFYCSVWIPYVWLLWGERNLIIWCDAAQIFAAHTFILSFRTVTWVRWLQWIRDPYACNTYWDGQTHNVGNSRNQNINW